MATLNVNTLSSFAPTSITIGSKTSGATIDTITTSAISESFTPIVALRVLPTDSLSFAGASGNATYYMRAYKTTATTGYVYWTSLGAADGNGSQSGYDPLELQNIVVIYII